jgi:hypothetical protein
MINGCVSVVMAKDKFYIILIKRAKRCEKRRKTNSLAAHKIGMCSKQIDQQLTAMFGTFASTSSVTCPKRSTTFLM